MIMGVHAAEALVHNEPRLIKRVLLAPYKTGTGVEIDFAAEAAASKVSETEFFGGLFESAAGFLLQHQDETGLGDLTSTNIGIRQEDGTIHLAVTQKLLGRVLTSAAARGQPIESILGFPDGTEPIAWKPTRR